MNDMTLFSMLRQTRKDAAEAAVEAAMAVVDDDVKAGGALSPEALKEQLRQRIREAVIDAAWPRDPNIHIRSLPLHMRNGEIREHAVTHTQLSDLRNHGWARVELDGAFISILAFWEGSRITKLEEGVE